MTAERDPASPERRAWLAAARNLGLGLLGAGATRAARAQSADLGEDLVFTFNGGMNQTIFEKQIFPPFAKQSGVKNLLFVPGTSADNVAKIKVQARSPVVDVITLSGSSAYTAIDDHLVDPFDASQIPNLANIDPAAAGNDRYLMPLMLANVCIIYNKQVFQQRGFPPPTSWNDLWDPKFAGHVGSYSVAAVAGVSLLLTAAYITTGDYKNYDAGFKKVAALRSSVIDFFASGGGYDTAFTQGDLWIGVNVTTRAWQMKDQGWPVGCVTPKEGSIAQPGFLSLVKGRPHPQAAYAWMNYMLTEPAQELVMRGLGYSPVIKGMKISDADRPFFPPTDKMIFPDWRAVSADMGSIVDRWNREIER